MDVDSSAASAGRAGAEGAANEFRDSMPAAYREAFSAEEAREHGAIAARRGGRTVHLELWREFEDGTRIVCAVADDRPGLLSTICRVLVAHDLDVMSAQIHCRQPNESAEPEAFDLFWLSGRSASAPLTPELLLTLEAELEAAVTARARSTVPPGRTSGVSSTGAPPPPRVFFNTSALRRGEYVLVVEALDCPGLLLSITLALHRLGAQIVSSDVRTDGKLARDCFTIVDPGSKPLSSQRLAALRQAVVESVRQRLFEQFPGE